MAEAIDFSNTLRVLLLIDLQSQNPNPNYINSILTTSKLLLSFNSLSSSLFSFNFLFNSNSIPFNSPEHTLESLSNALRSIRSNKPTSSPVNCAQLARFLLQLGNAYEWKSESEKCSSNSGCDVKRVRSNLVVWLSPVCQSVKSLAEFMCVDVIKDLVGCRGRFRDCFGDVSDVFNGKDIQFCWIDVCSGVGEREVSESEEACGFVKDEIRRFGWGFCSTDLIVLGSALVPFGLMYPYIAVSCKLLDCCGLDKRIYGELVLEVLDVSGKPLECKCCDLELLHLKVSSDIIKGSKAQDHNLLNAFLGSWNDEIMKLRVTSVKKHTEYAYLEEFSSEFVLVKSTESGKKGKDGLDNMFTDKVFELFGKHCVPTWQIFLSFLYKEGYWALLSLSNSNRDYYTGILKPLTVNSAILLLVDNNQILVQNSCKTNNAGGVDPQKGVFPFERTKMKKHSYRELTWNSFCKAAYEFLDVDLAEVYFAHGIKKSKKLKFLKCWMKEVKKRSLSLNSMPPGLWQTGLDLNEQKETDGNDNLAASYQEKVKPLPMHICSDQSTTQDDDGLVSCSETSESFFSNLPKKIQLGVESTGIDLKILAERLVNSSVYWLHKKHETIENLDESCTVQLQVAEIIKLLLRAPRDLKEHKDYNPSSTSKYLVREYELQILLRLEIFQSEYAGSMKRFMKMKLVKQICNLLEIIQYLVEGGFQGDLSLYDYVERTIKTRYSKTLGDVIDKIYDQMDLLPFGENDDEDQAFMFNSEDSYQSCREKLMRNDMSAGKMIQDSVSSEHELEKVNSSQQDQTKEDYVRKLNEAREKREKARRRASFTRRMPDLQRVWAPNQSKLTKVKPETLRKKQMRDGYSVVCETPLIGSKPSTPSGQRANPVSKALFQA